MYRIYIGARTMCWLVLRKEKQIPACTKQEFNSHGAHLALNKKKRKKKTGTDESRNSIFRTLIAT